MKRLFDIVLCLVLLMPMLPIVSLLIVLVQVVDGTPIFFIQERVGRFGKYFKIYKFRTLKPASKGAIGNFEPGNLSRITKLGRVLRKTKLDELPQLFNVLLGDMSFVGPRPEVLEWVNIHSDQWKKVLSVRPGITGPAVLEFINEEEILAASSDPEKEYREVILPQKLLLYETYIESHSLLGDFNIILKTCLSIIKR
jgi:lipopolysaccharide/colanic/teichoic acid biosynthesis glycosyltransferase